MKYLPLLVLQLTAASACVSISHFGEAKCEMDTVDRRVYYTLCHDTGLCARLALVGQSCFGGTQRTRRTV